MEETCLANSANSGTLRLDGGLAWVMFVVGLFTLLPYSVNPLRGQVVVHSVSTLAEQLRTSFSPLATHPLSSTPSRVPQAAHSREVRCGGRPMNNVRGARVVHGG